MSDMYKLDRFVAAQDAGGTYARALDELRAGQKTSHWLGRSATARRYAISSLDEGRAYLEHPILGTRLRESASALLDVADRSAEDILGGIDAIKLRSSMTLFEQADPSRPLFGQVLDRYFGGQRDAATLRPLDAG